MLGTKALVPPTINLTRITRYWLSAATKMPMPSNFRVFAGILEPCDGDVVALVSRCTIDLDFDAIRLELGSLVVKLRRFTRIA